MKNWRKLSMLLKNMRPIAIKIILDKLDFWAYLSIVQNDFFEDARF